MNVYLIFYQWCCQIQRTFSVVVQNYFLIVWLIKTKYSVHSRTEDKRVAREGKINL